MSLRTKARVSKGSYQVRAQAAKAQQQARKAAAQVAPYTASARMSARQGLHTARAWTAPRLDRTGTALQDKVAPSVSAMLSRAAHRIEPEQPKRRRRWPFFTAGLITAGAITAAAGAIARGRAGRDRENEAAQDSQPSQAQQQEKEATAEADGRVRAP